MLGAFSNWWMYSDSFVDMPAKLIPTLYGSRLDRIALLRLATCALKSIDTLLKTVSSAHGHQIESAWTRHAKVNHRLIDLNLARRQKRTHPMHLLAPALPANPPQSATRASSHSRYSQAVPPPHPFARTFRTPSPDLSAPQSSAYLKGHAQEHSTPSAADA